ncbi:hypothetical protein [Candidatus Galacturonibacter soehngenii]|uniref:Uncharacterized protein n=1 Tax=Candidatus Galacturonatibacter soehngenii TaxID=2307010 RepID=A0A7V7QK45_9FIRM|nr:hypothetical protein [Candidatus Galacturonibacter soehngenii]KAB1438062.1 hypothetical protein F7O84_10880 [Candidatus Galacturonibacter soehngenii]
MITGGSKSNSSATGGGSGGSRTGATGSYNSSGQSGGGYTDPFTNYLANQSDDAPPVDPVTQSLQNRYGGASVTNVTSSYAYVDGKLVTAMSDNEHKMCLDAKKIQTKVKNAVNGMPEPVKQLATFLGGFADSVLKNVYSIDIGTEPYSKTYQTTYNKGEITGDIVSMLLGLITAASGASTMQKGAGITLVSTATGQIEISGAGAGIMVLGATETAAGIKISISASKKLGEDISKGDSETGKNGTYEKADYHGKTNNSVKNKAPNNGQEALDNSVSIGKNTTRRVGISDGEIVVFDETTKGVFHGHVRSWSELSEPMKAALKKAGMVTKKGKIIK